MKYLNTLNRQKTIEPVSNTKKMEKAVFSGTVLNTEEDMDDLKNIIPLKLLKDSSKSAS